jgi:hypothetical protein
MAINALMFFSFSPLTAGDAEESKLGFLIGDCRTNGERASAYLSMRSRFSGIDYSKESAAKDVHRHPVGVEKVVSHRRLSPAISR